MDRALQPFSPLLPFLQAPRLCGRPLLKTGVPSACSPLCSPPLTPTLHCSPQGNPKGLLLGGSSWKKKSRVIVSSPQVLSPPFPFWGAGRGHRAHTEVPGLGVDAGSPSPSTLNVHSSEGLGPKHQRDPHRLWHYPVCCEGWGDPAAGGSAVVKEEAQR